jgi:UPF0755 protein
VDRMTEAAGSGWRNWLWGGLLVILLALLAGFAVFYSSYQHFQQQQLNVPADGLLYEFSSGASLSRLAHDLADRDVIEQPRLLILLGRQMDLAHRLQAGEYRLREDMTPADLLNALAEGDIEQYSLTVIEGQTFRELLAAVRASDVIVSTLETDNPDEIMSRLGHPGEHPEGRFLPDTYLFPRGTTDVGFLQRAYDAMQQRLASAWQDRDEGLPLESPYEALILASIVEKETGRADERPRIAGVFIQRLRKGMRLQTDPTVIYGMGESFDGNIRRRDLRTDTPYNTYTRDGLPPTPIALPGAAALEAVMHPDESGYLYFVATGDGQGSHYFSRTLKEHNMAVKKFQLGQSGITLPGTGH